MGNRIKISKDNFLCRGQKLKVDYDLDKNLNVIYGSNGSGKSTIAAAFGKIAKIDKRVDCYTGKAPFNDTFLSGVTKEDRIMMLSDEDKFFYEKQEDKEIVFHEKSKEILEIKQKIILITEKLNISEIKKQLATMGLKWKSKATMGPLLKDIHSLIGRKDDVAIETIKHFSKDMDLTSLHIIEDVRNMNYKYHELIKLLDRLDKSIETIANKRGISFDNYIDFKNLADSAVKFNWDKDFCILCGQTYTDGNNNTKSVKEIMDLVCRIEQDIMGNKSLSDIKEWLSENNIEDDVKQKIHSLMHNFDFNEHKKLCEEVTSKSMEPKFVCRNICKNIYDNLKISDLESLEKELASLEEGGMVISERFEKTFKNNIEMVFPSGIQTIVDGNKLIIHYKNTPLIECLEKNILSKGELNFLSTAFFLTMCKENDSKLIVIDDPVTSNDKSNIILLADIIWDLSDTKKTLLLTHNTEIIESLLNRGGTSSKVKMSFLLKDDNVIEIYKLSNNLYCETFSYLKSFIKNEKNKQTVEDVRFCLPALIFIRYASRDVGLFSLSEIDGWDEITDNMEESILENLSNAVKNIGDTQSNIELINEVIKSYFSPNLKQHTYKSVDEILIQSADYLMKNSKIEKHIRIILQNISYAWYCRNVLDDKGTTVQKRYLNSIIHGYENYGYRYFDINKKIIGRHMESINKKTP